MPGSAPSTPARHDPSVLTTLPSSSSFVFAEVPDVAVFVLCVIVERILRHLAVFVRDVVDHGTGDAVDHFGVARDDEGVESVFARVLVDQRGAGL
jgi:hypothetical protein